MSSLQTWPTSRFLETSRVSWISGAWLTHETSCGLESGIEKMKGWRERRKKKRKAARKEGERGGGTVGREVRRYKMKKNSHEIKGEKEAMKVNTIHWLLSDWLYDRYYKWKNKWIKKTEGRQGKGGQEKTHYWEKEYCKRSSWPWRRTDRQTDRQTDRRTDGRTDGQPTSQTDARTSARDMNQKAIL